MSWFLLEAFVALVIAVAIVWWTTAVRRKPPGSAQGKPGDADRQ